MCCSNHMQTIKLAISIIITGCTHIVIQMYRINVCGFEKIDHIH